MSTRKKLIDKLSSTTSEVSREDLSFIVSECFEYIANELKNNSRIEVRGFGSFKVNEKRVVSSLTRSGDVARKTVRYKSAISLD